MKLIRRPNPIATALNAKQRLKKLSDTAIVAFLQRYFQTSPGGYGEGDVFLGIKVPPQRKLAQEFSAMPPREVDQLLRSAIHEERSLALMILVIQYERGDEKERRRITRHYLRRTRFINNWDLVDSSAHFILGAQFFGGDLSTLQQLLKSPRWWERRIAVIATFHFIRNGHFQTTLDFAGQLLDDEHDLMHKAVGWMLREIGKKDVAVLRTFLDEHAARMPRTMLRYAIERLAAGERKRYMKMRAAS
jgi:3-methyladenine DNA glycosylase AlkD